MSTLGCVMHFHSEELMIKDWILHHSRLVDKAILINHSSTDRSVEIAESVLPAGWQIVDSRLADFNADANGREVEYWETQLNTDWKIALNTTEYIFNVDIKEQLERWEFRDPNVMAIGMRAVCLVDRDEKFKIGGEYGPWIYPPTNPPPQIELWRKHTWGFVNYEANIPLVRRYRFYHRADHGHYQTGRHAVNLPYQTDFNLLHLHFSFAPYPECKQRKLQIQERIPEIDKSAGFGFEHIVTSEQLDQKRLEMLQYSYNLFDDETYKDCYEKFMDTWYKFDVSRL